MDRKKRSQLANQAKKEYIKRGKKENVLKKINEKAKNLKSAKPPTNDNESAEESDTTTETDDEEQYILHFSSESENEQIKRKNVRKQRVNNVDNSNDKELLKLQKDIELLRLNQIKQSKKINKEKTQIIEKPVNHTAQALKKKLLVEF